MNAVALVSINPLASSPKTFKAKSIPYTEHPTVYNKQSEHEQSPLQHPSAFPLGHEVLSNLKSGGVNSLLNMI